MVGREDGGGEHRENIKKGEEQLHLSRRLE